MRKQIIGFISTVLCLALMITLLPQSSLAGVVLPPDGGGGGGGGGAVGSTLTVSYDGNGAVEGLVPSSVSTTAGSSVTIPGNAGSLVKPDTVFSGWNTNADGSGTQYYSGSILIMPGTSVVLYAIWVKNDIVYDQSKWPIQDSDYNVAYSTTDGKNTIVPTSYQNGNVILYKTPEPGIYAAKYNFVGFNDISDTNWARQFVWFLSARKIFEGKSKELFAPEDNITRAEFIKILACMTPGFKAGKAPAAPVTDVTAGDWYSPYVNWGIENEIDAGSGGLFRPRDAITREEMCVMIAKYTAFINYKLGSINPPKTFNDQSAISPSAASEVSALQQSGLISGKDNNMFDPQGVSSRAQAASIICRLLMGILAAIDNPSVIPAG